MKETLKNAGAAKSIFFLLQAKGGAPPNLLALWYTCE